ncbi:hypothetical protein BU17DRAFT_35612, partial [Hysterangium stoloniferum]
IHMAWVPGHLNIAMNEKADTEAKSTATGNSTLLTQPIAAFKQELPHRVTGLRAHHKIITNHEWHMEWSASPRARKLSRFNKSPLTQKYSNSTVSSPSNPAASSPS